MIISLLACIFIGQLQRWGACTVNQRQRSAADSLVQPGELNHLLKRLTGNLLLVLTRDAKGGKGEEIK